MSSENLDDVVTSFCRVCLNVENVMIDTSNTIEDFDKSIDELLFDCANMKRLDDLKVNLIDNYPKLICEECCAELIVVVRFREKCANAEEFLQNLLENRFMRQTNRTFIHLGQIETLIEPEEIIESDAINEDHLVESFDDKIAYMIELNDRDDDEPFGEEQLNDDEQSTEKRKKNTKINNVYGTKINHSCRFCGAGFTHLENLMKHLQTHEGADDSDVRHEYLNESNHDSPNESNSQEEQSNTDEKSKTKKRRNLRKDHKCAYCSKAFCSQSLLSAHVRIHTGERPFTCTECPKSFKTRGALELHARRHSGIKPYRCTVCNRGFVETSNLKVHMRTHTGEKPHQCTRCDRTFSRVFLLQIHQRTHTGERPYACDVCPRSFAQQCDLRAHKRIHSGERPHQCKICSKGFIKNSGLTQHMRRHKNYTTTADDILVEVIEETEETNEDVTKDNSSVDDEYDEKTNTVIYTT